MRIKKKALTFLTAITLLGTGVLAFNAYLPTSFVGVSAETQTQTTNDFPCEITTTHADYSAYGSKEYIRYTAEEAAAAGIPEGYEGDVLQVIPRDGQINCGIVLDFSANKVPFALVQALQFRVYLGVHTANSGIYPQIRIPRPFYNTQGHWVYQRGNESTPDGEWTTVTIDESNTHNGSFGYLSDENGYLSKFELCLRTNSAIPFYIDSISYSLAKNDGVAPEITYAGAEEIITSVGADFTVNATAYDAQEKRDIEVQKTWSAGALDENGQLTGGTHTLTLTASDFFGNKAEKVVKVTVTEPDTQVPVIHIPDVMYAETGTIFLANMPVTDNRNVVSTTITWSQGALDSEGKLTEGTHVLTVTAVDDSGNQAQKEVTVYVTNDGNGTGEVIDEEELTSAEDSTSDSENSSTSDSESSTDSDSESTSDTTSESDSESDSVSDTASESDSDSDSVSDTASESDSDSDSVSDTTSESSSDVVSSESSDTTSETPKKPEQEKAGCGGAIGFGTLGVVALLCAAYAMKKKKED